MTKIEKARQIYEQEGAMALLRAGRRFLSNQHVSFLKVLNRAILSRWYGYEYQSVMDADWDTLVILDGCRYDLFEQLNSLPGTLEKRHSCGSATAEFLRKTVVEEYRDTVYVTANPQYRVWDLDGGFHHVVDVWQSDWDDNLGTVRPERVTKRAIEAHAQYPHKRILVHYMQPHYPFIGPTGRDLPSTRRVEELAQRASGKSVEKTDDIWGLLAQGAVSEEEVLTAYQENLELALPHVATLLSKIDGKTVVTSDHGNLYGECPFPFRSKIYGHPIGIHAKHLIEVPWLVSPADSRRKITEGEVTVHSEDSASDVVVDRLEKLGYVN